MVWYHAVRYGHILATDIDVYVHRCIDLDLAPPRANAQKRRANRERREVHTRCLQALRSLGGSRVASFSRYGFLQPRQAPKLALAPYHPLLVRRKQNNTCFRGMDQGIATQANEVVRRADLNPPVLRCSRPLVARSGSLRPSCALPMAGGVPQGRNDLRTGSGHD